MIDPKRAVSEISKNYGDPTWWRDRLTTHVVGPTTALFNEPGSNYFEEDWDNLFLLDAARADLFEEAADIDSFNSYTRRRSPGSSSAEWMRECFGDQTWDDVVYVSGNPWVSRIGSDSFYRVYNLWVDEFGLEEDASASEGILKDHDPKGLGTIEAKHLSDVARKKHAEHPDKRLVVHYFQPHAPCIGRRDGSVRDEIERNVGPGQNLRNRLTTFDQVWEAYKENLLYALTHARKLAADVGGKTVYSADHGELMGEWLWPFPMRGYAHPTGVYHDKLLEVPWATEQIGDRREIQSGTIMEHEEHEEEIEGHLEALGYK